MRVAIYARYSTDLQSETSIEDQVEVCRRYAEIKGWIVSKCKVLLPVGHFGLPL